MVRIVVPYEACVLSLFVIFCAGRVQTRTNHFSFRDLLQELILMESGAPQSWPKKPDLLALSAAAVCEHRLPTVSILEKLGIRCQCGWGCQNATMHGTLVRDKVFQARSLLRELVTADSWVSGTWLHWRDWLALRLAAAHENNRLPPHLVLQQEIKPNLTLQDFRDGTARPAQLDFYCDLQGRQIDFTNTKTLVGRCRDRP